MHKMQPPSEYCTKFNSTFVICLKFVFIEMLDKLIHTQCVGTRLYIRSCLLCELTALQLVSTVTRSDPGSHNRLDLIHSLVPTHFVCISLSSISIKTNFKQITKVELNFVQYSEGGYILCMTSCYFCRLFTNLSDVTGYVTRVT